jgi:predicted small lipoprotein YifL
MKTLRAVAPACSLLLLFALAACGNKGPLVMPPPPDEQDAVLEEAEAVDDAGAVADPSPADEDAGVTPFPPEAEPRRTPEAVPPVDADADPTEDGSDLPDPTGDAD